ncbi:hypothetical protein [Nakamurella lactea]|uniref:hypothetical protein n=1 Tax=Nakamurella lactea TaxID=459515 RepID=UPI00048F4C5C|nr:hypothetical protein [Nakamurella lactea]
MQWWRWVAAAVAAVLLVILLLLWFDTLKERQGWSTARAARPPAIASIAVPIGFLLVLVLPWWLGLILVAGPAVAVAVMALAS